ncbi:nuclear fragile X mental retardation-interacting protein 1-like [Neodiprion fabricii]|uniref:nuclear fragile X mental retardation-interacting protein 1-like n=1 Tax=Neodiprion fabricii TaxID=2872261 RepID=UPI001ED953D0|nr:nuclear fragile X mental retardation-interacting protein 1-like [Neodiprion fabricii]
MSPLNRGPMLGPRMPPVGMRPMPPPRFGGRLPPPGMPLRMPPHPMFGPMRQRMPLPGPGMPMFGPRIRGMPPMMMGPMMGPRGMGPCGPPPMRPTSRGMLPSQGLPHMRARLPLCGINMKGKGMNNSKKVSKLEELELKKPWMTDEIRSEIQKKNKLYAKAKKNKDAMEWEEFKDLRNKVTRMIRDAKTEYLAKNPEQATLYSADTSAYDERDENYQSSEEEHEYYCEVCDREFPSEESLARHMGEHRVCGIDDCVFSAHPKLVEKHISMQHTTGLYHRMKNLSTPEDIQNWIAERKRRYPTKANIKHLAAEALEKQKRYEVIREKKSITEINRIHKNETKKVTRRKTRRRPRALPVPAKAMESQLYRGLQMFPGTLNLRQSTSDEEYSLIEDSDNEVDIRSTGHISGGDEVDLTMNLEANKNFSLSLVADYGTDSDEDDGPEEVPFKKIKVDTNIPVSVPALTNPDDDCHINDKSTTRNNDSRHRFEHFEKTRQNNNKYKNERNNQRFHQNKNHTAQGILNTNKNRLLNKLLSRSIQHERNLICQCIKYIVDNNYFE